MKKNQLFVIAILILTGTDCTKKPEKPSDPLTYATTYYVATNGNDGNSKAQAQSTSTPWRTINYAVSKLAAGDILYVRGGTYVEVVNVSLSGTASAPITISAYMSELPIVDGNYTLPTGKWGALVTMNGNYIHMSGFEVKNTILGNAARGLGLYGHHNTASKFNVHHIYDNGILITGDYGIVEDSKLWQSCLSNVNGTKTAWASGLTAARDKVNGITDYAIMRRNIVYNNWGEGFSTYEAQGTRMEDNIIYDNWAQNIYVSDATNVLVQGNMIYTTTAFTAAKNAHTGITLADEVSNGTTKPHSANNRLINNLLYNANISALSWTEVPGVGLNNVIIANNTLINGRFTTCGSNNSNSQIRNNIIINSMLSIPTNAGIVFSNNFWSVAPSAAAVGAGDVIGDPLLAKTGLTSPGQLTADYFKIASTSSLAINKAMVLPQVTDDYFKSSRGTSPDIGGHEYD